VAWKAARKELKAIDRKSNGNPNTGLKQLGKN